MPALPDATQPDLRAGLAWEQVHRVRPPALLSCRACGAAMSAKLPKLGMRFFAHRADASDCPTVGETIEHRLLKIELAAAIRDAGWYAELEVPGNGWRADVLATSPGGSRRIAFEAQLAAATVQDLAERTATMAADAVEVCWVTDKDTTWVSQRSSARVQRTAPVGQQRDLLSLSEAEITARRRLIQFERRYAASVVEPPCSDGLRHASHTRRFLGQQALGGELRPERDLDVALELRLTRRAQLRSL